MHANMDWLQSRVNISPERIAVVDSVTGDSWTYRELDERANRIAHFFMIKGVEKGDRVAILAPNHIGYLDFFFACMRIGAIFIPLNWRLSKDELAYVLQDSEPKIIGVAPSFLDRMNQMELGAVFITISSNEYEKELDFESHQINIELDEAEPLAMIYTGGTTGRPKGVVLSHRSILWNALNTIVSWNIGADDVTLITTPMFHTGGLNVYTLPILLAGGKVVLSPEFKPEKTVKDLIKYKCTVVLFVPTMYHMIIQTKEFQQATFPDIKVFVSGGAPCSHKIYNAFREKGVAFKEGYGLTEAGPNNFYIDPEDTARKIGSVGKPMIFNDIKIVKANGESAKDNEVGELVLRSYHSFEYYWNKPKETAEVIKDGWVHTGDLAKQDEDGYVYIVGRKKDMIITGGENVYPLEIEHWLETHDLIDEAVVVGLPDEKWGEIVTGFVSLKGELTEEELKSYCNQKLTRYKVPKKIYFLSELPKTHVGKIDKATLREKYSIEESTSF